MGLQKEDTQSSEDIALQTHLGRDNIDMLRLFAALAVVVALVHRGEAVLGKFNDPTVDCSATGFQPTFVYNTEGETHQLGLEIDIGGDNDNSSSCVHTVARNTTHSGNTTFTYLNYMTLVGGGD